MNDGPTLEGQSTRISGSALLMPLGKTSGHVECVSLGGEGILRTRGNAREAVPVIVEALRLGVRYCDTAPAYASSQDYYGAAFREVGSGVRDSVFLASKTHDRSRDGSLRLLDDSLHRLTTNWLDLWQLHDLRTHDDLNRIFGKGGALEAALMAKEDGRVRHIGITGHHDPSILLEAMRRHPFDTVLCALNPADNRRMPFLTTVVAEARRQGMGVIGMKVFAHGDLLTDGAATAEELIRYAMNFTDTMVIGCSSVEEVRANLDVGRRASPLSIAECTELEARIRPNAARYDTFKGE